MCMCRVDSFLAGAEAFTQPSRALPQRTLEVTRVADANRGQPSAGALSSVQFHPSGQLLLTAGLDKRLHFFQVRYSASFDCSLIPDLFPDSSLCACSYLTVHNTEMAVQPQISDAVQCAVHPPGQLLLTASLDKCLHFFQVWSLCRMACSQ